MDTPGNDEQLVSVLLERPEWIRASVWEFDRLIAERAEGIHRTVDADGRMIGYQLGPGYKGTVANVILSAKGMKVGLAYSAGFDDPDDLLRGSGKVHKHVPIAGVDQVHDEAFARLIDQAVAACRERLGG